MSNPLKQLAEAGQSIWLDYMHRKLMEGGELKRLVEEDAVTGLTSNPSIFEKAIGAGGDYDDRIKAALAAGVTDPMDIYERLAIKDIQDAADQLKPVWDRTHGADGYVSLEVSPYLALDTDKSAEEAERLWKVVDRKNLMVKVPGTTAGGPAIRRLIGQGINVNVTLLFALNDYLEVAEAHLAGLEDFKAKGRDISTVHGVASFFVSRIDTQIDKKIDERVKAGDPRSEELKALRGKVAIANAKIAYQRYIDMIGTSRWKALSAAGAAPQRLLWASTGAKDPAYSDVLYVESLVGPDTVNTMPTKTLEAFKDHGQVRQTLNEDVDAATDVLTAQAHLGLGLDDVTRELVTEGVKSFTESFDKLLGAVRSKRDEMMGKAA